MSSGKVAKAYYGSKRFQTVSEIESAFEHPSDSALLADGLVDVLPSEFGLLEGLGYGPMGPPDPEAMGLWAYGSVICDRGAREKFEHKMRRARVPQQILS